MQVTPLISYELKRMERVKQLVSSPVSILEERGICLLLHLMLLLSVIIFKLHYICQSAGLIVRQHKKPSCHRQNDCQR